MSQANDETLASLAEFRRIREEMGAPEVDPVYIYKILPYQPEEPLPAEFPLSEFDVQEGFVHLSVPSQIPTVADMFFSHATHLWILRIEFATLKDPIKWEAGFPHLYGNFGAADVRGMEMFSRTEGQKWEESMRSSTWLI